MSDFSDRPFVAGSLIGLRAFDVDSLGRLQGPTYGGVFAPGENVAKCGGASPYGAMVAATRRAMAQSMRDSMWFTYSTTVETSLSKSGVAEVRSPEPAKPVHVVGGKDCECGYYAYFNGENTYAKTGRVSAIIEGYGVCTVGSRGFRASKAKLVALVLPRTSRYWGTWRSALTWVLLFIAIGAFNGVNGNWVTAGFDAALTAFWGVALGFRIKRRKNITNLFKAHALCRRNYPDVPIYRTVRRALRAHPLTPQPGPTPDDDDFWVRSA